MDENRGYGKWEYVKEDVEEQEQVEEMKKEIGNHMVRHGEDLEQFVFSHRRLPADQDCPERIMVNADLKELA